MSRRSWIPVAVAAAAVLLLSGCATHNSPGDATTTTPASSPSASAPTSPSPTASPTTTQAAGCTQGSLTAALAATPDHSAGQSHYTVKVTNSGAAPCPLPAANVSVQPEAAAAGQPLGNSAASSAPTAASTLAPGAAVSVQFALVNSENYDPASCAAKPAAAIRIAWGASGPAADLALPAPVPVCTAAAVQNVQQVTVAG